MLCVVLECNSEYVTYGVCSGRQICMLVLNQKKSHNKK